MFKRLKTQKKSLLSLFVAFTLLFSIAVPTVVFAADGSAGQKPMNYIGAYLTTISNNTSTTGADITTTPVSSKPMIKIVVDKNVVSDNVWANNQKCITLQSSSGANVAVNVTRISDTVNFAERQNIFITPVNYLTAGAKYKIVISPQLIAKNEFSTLGMTTNNQPVTVNFTVKSNQVIYNVKSGDTLYKIAQIYGITASDLIIANNLSSGSYLYVGQAVVIPTIAHAVQSGDTLYKIALKYGSYTNAIVTANNLSSTGNIYVGQTLYVPVNLYVYTVKSGDTLWSVAVNNATTISNLTRLNNLSSNSLYIGQKLKINY